MEKRGGAAARALEEQEHVDRDHLVAADRRVRHIPLGVETRLPRGCHDCLIERVRDLAIGVAAESPQKLEHGKWLPEGFGAQRGCIALKAGLPLLPSGASRSRNTN